MKDECIEMPKWLNMELLKKYATVELTKEQRKELEKIKNEIGLNKPFEIEKYDWMDIDEKERTQKDKRVY